MLTNMGGAEPGMGAEVQIHMSRLHCETEFSEVECPSYEATSFSVWVLDETDEG
jgi:hypothetical protein